jgi:PAS domain S-box-containing protein
MNLFHVFGYPLFFIAALEIALGTILLRQNPRNSPVNKSVAAFSFFSAAYVLSNGISYILASKNLDFNFFNRFAWIGWFAIPAGLQFIYFLKDEKSRTARRIGYILYPFWGAVLLLTLFTDLVEPGDPSLIPFINVDGPLENPLRIVGMIMIIWIMIEIYRLRSQVGGIKKAQLNYFFHGTLIFAAGGALIVGLLPLFSVLNPALGAYFSFPWVVLTFYAITRHRLFDIRFVISRALTITILALVISLLHIGLFQLFAPALGATSALVVSIFLIGFIFFGTPISRRVQRGIQHIIIRDAYDYQGILKESSKAIITFLNLEDLLHYLVDSMHKSLEVENVCLFLKEKNGRFTLRHGYGNREDTDQQCQIPPAIIPWFQQTQHVVVREELEKAAPGDNGSMVADYMQKIGAELGIPLIYKGHLQGFLTLGLKGNGEPYMQSDIDLLEALAGHAALAIEHARLYEEARQTKESLLSSESKFRTLADTAAIAIFIHQGGNFLYANHTAEIIGGYTIDEYLTMNFLSLVHPAYVDMIKARARDRLAGGQAPPQYEFKIVRKNGEERWVLMTAGVTNYEGKPSVIGTLIDITARKRAEEEKERLFNELEKATSSLKESEAKFRTLAETTTAAIFIHQGQKLVYANSAGETMSGYAREELLQEDFWALIHPDYKELAKERGQARMRGERAPQEYEFKFVKKNGEERWAATTAGIIEYGGKPAIIATLFDITDWKRAEEAKVKFYEESVKQYQERIEEEKRHRLEKEKILMDLHDGIGGITTNISILSELAQKARDGETVKKTLATISRLSREGISEIRSFMHSLDNKDLNWRTLAAELRNQGTNMVEPHNIKFMIATEVEDMQEQPGSLVWVNMFKIYKEALTNVIKHSKAATVNVAFRADRSGVLLVIEDDGVGLGGGRVGGRGLSHMKTRAGEIGGKVNIVADRGTRVNFELPLPLKYPDEGMVIQ